MPTKAAKDRRGGFTGGTVEAEAMPAGVMRELLCGAIEQFIDQRELRVMKTVEEEERGYLSEIAAIMRRPGDER